MSCQKPGTYNPKSNIRVQINGVFKYQTSKKGSKLWNFVQSAHNLCTIQIFKHQIYITNKFNGFH
jgi:hypothetical protein